MDGDGLGVRVAWEEGAALSEVGASSSVATGSPRAAGGDAEGKGCRLTTTRLHCRKYRNYNYGVNYICKHETLTA